MKIPFRYFPLLLVLCALTVRGFYYYQFQENPFFDHVPKDWDQTVYNEGAKAFANGNLFAIPSDQAKFSPLYQFFLGSIYWLFGPDLKVIWVAQFLLGTASTLLVYAIGNHFFKPGISFLAGLLFTFYGINWLYEGSLYREPFITFLELMSCFLLLRFSKHPNFFWLIWSAVSLSLFMQSRTTNLLIVPFALAYLWKNVFCHKSTGRKLLTSYIAIFLLISMPSLVWVYVVHGSWSFYDQDGPETLLLSNMTDYSGRSYFHTEAYNEIIRTLPLKTVPVIIFLAQNALEHPLDYLQLYLRKLYFFFNNYEVPNTLNFYLFQEFSPILKWGSIPFVFIGSLGIMGCFLLLKRKRGWTLLHSYFFVSFFMYFPFFVISRFRLQIVPFLAMFSAYALWMFYQKVKKKNWGYACIMVICFLLFLRFEKTVPLPEGKVRIIDYVNSGLAYLNNDNADDNHRGLVLFKKAWNLSRSLKQELRQSKIVERALWYYFYKEAQISIRKGETQKAIDSLKQAILFDYSSAPTHYLYAGILLKNQNNREALLEALQSASIHSDSTDSHLLLASIYSQALNSPLWALYHLQKAEDLIDWAGKELLADKIKMFQNKLNELGPFDQSSATGTLLQTQTLLLRQVQLPFAFPFDLELPAGVSRWSSDEVKHYLIKLYQYLNLSNGANIAAIHYQLGMLYSKKTGDENAALYYFEKALDHGIQLPSLVNLLNIMTKRRSMQPIS